jgi:hypothetical protein
MRAAKSKALQAGFFTTRRDLAHAPRRPQKLAAARGAPRELRGAARVTDVITANPALAGQAPGKDFFCFCGALPGFRPHFAAN